MPVLAFLVQLVTSSLGKTNCRVFLHEISPTAGHEGQQGATHARPHAITDQVLLAGWHVQVGKTCVLNDILPARLRVHPQFGVGKPHEVLLFKLDMTDLLPANVGCQAGGFERGCGHRAPRVADSGLGLGLTQPHRVRVNTTT